VKAPDFPFKRILLATGSVLAVCGLGFVIFLLRFVPLVGQPEFPVPGSPEEAREQDLQVLDLWARKDWSVTDAVRSRISEALSDPAKSIHRMSDVVFELWIARTLALADNAHTNVSPESRRARLNAVPLHFYLFSDGLYILEARRDHSDMLGARVLSIDGRDIEELIRGLKPYHGGPTAFNRAHAALNLASPALLHAAGLTEHPDSYELTLQHGTRVVRAAVRAEPAASVTPHGLGQTSALQPGTQDGWVHFLGSRFDFYLTDVNPDLGKGFLIEPWLDGLYIRMDAHSDSVVSLSEFRRRVIRKTIESDPAFLVLDLRLNRGGNWSTGYSRNVVGALPQEAGVFILISNHTFSAGIIEAALFKAAAGKRAVIVGDGPGDRLRFWANGGTSLKLPNSRIGLRIWTGYEDWASGCSNWRVCFWITMLTGVSVGDLDPDIRAPLIFSAYANGVDPALVAVERQVRRAAVFSSD